MSWQPGCNGSLTLLRADEPAIGEHAVVSSPTWFRGHRRSWTQATQEIRMPKWISADYGLGKQERPTHWYPGRQVDPMSQARTQIVSAEPVETGEQRSPLLVHSANDAHEIVQ